MDQYKDDGGIPSAGTKEHRIYIGNRDDWVCGLCKEPIDKTLSPFESDWAGVVGHIIPKSLGGKNSDSNRQIAHFKCNATKGNTSLPPDVLKDVETERVRRMAIAKATRIKRAERIATHNEMLERRMELRHLMKSRVSIPIDPDDIWNQ